jgi:hypothetical protein
MAGKTSRKSAKAANKAVAKAPHRAKSARRGPRKRVAAKAAKSRTTAPTSQSRRVAKPVLLAGGNPQIAKADGDAPVQAYIGAMPGWKRDVGRRLDALSCAPSPTCARPSSGTRPSMASRARAGSSTFIASRSTSKWRSSAARHCVLSPRRVQAQGRALPRRPRGRPARRGARGELDSACIGASRLGPVAPAGILASSRSPRPAATALAPVAPPASAPIPAWPTAGPPPHGCARVSRVNPLRVLAT